MITQLEYSNYSATTVIDCQRKYDNTYAKIEIYFLQFLPLKMPLKELNNLLDRILYFI